METEYGPLRYHAHPHGRGHHVMRCTGACRRGDVAHPHRVGIDDAGSGLPLVRGVAEELLAAPYAIVTAEKYGRSEAENRDNLGLLNKALTDMGYTPIPATGFYEGNPEESFFVPGLPEDAAVALGDLFNQESVLVNGELVYTDRNRPRRRFENVRFGPEAEGRKAWTRVHHRGRTQSFALF